MGGLVCLLTQPPRLVYRVPRSACSPAAANHRLWYAGQRIDDHHKPGVTMLHAVSWRVTLWFLLISPRRVGATLLRIGQAPDAEV